MARSSLALLWCALLLWLPSGCATQGAMLVVRPAALPSLERDGYVPVSISMLSGDEIALSADHPARLEGETLIGTRAHGVVSIKRDSVLHLTHKDGRLTAIMTRAGWLYPVVELIEEDNESLTVDTGPPAAENGLHVPLAEARLFRVVRMRSPSAGNRAPCLVSAAVLVVTQLLILWAVWDDPILEWNSP